MKKQISTWNIKAGWGCILTEQKDHWEGRYISPYGIAWVYCEKPIPNNPRPLPLILRMDFVYQGREYSKSIKQKKSFSPRSVAVQTHKFIREIVFKIAEDK